MKRIKKEELQGRCHVRRWNRSGIVRWYVQVDGEQVGYFQKRFYGPGHSKHEKKCFLADNELGVVAREVFCSQGGEHIFDESALTDALIRQSEPGAAKGPDYYRQKARQMKTRFHHHELH